MCVKIQIMKDLKYYIEKALNNKFALGAFNFSNLESLQGITSACLKTNSPAIISVSESAFEYIGEKYLIGLSQSAKSVHTPLFLHLDHGKSFEMCKKAVDMGFDSVMIDGSSLPFQENIELTKKVVQYAHSKNVLVEGEFGQIKGIEDNVSSTESHLTDPMQAQKFVKETGVDMLAVAIGTSHGAYKYNGKQTLKFDILEEIEKLLPHFPLVLHGASNIDQSLIAQINQNGGDIQTASGVPIDLIKKCVRSHNIIKINTDTDIRLAMTAEVRKFLNNDSKIIDSRKYLGKGREKIQNQVEFKIKNVFMSENQV